MLRLLRDSGVIEKLQGVMPLDGDLRVEEWRKETVQVVYWLHELFDEFYHCN